MSAGRGECPRRPAPGLYSRLAPWFALMSDPEAHAADARRIERLVTWAGGPKGGALLELGSGVGAGAAHLKRNRRCTLVDLAPEMLAESADANPECEHVVGDMREVRLGRTFDVVCALDSIGYMRQEADLSAALATVAAHLGPAGVAVLVPDFVSETFVEATSAGGHDGLDGRAARYLEWRRAAGPRAYEVDYAFVLRAPGARARLVAERHRFGLFPLATWERLILAAGLEPVVVELEDPGANGVAILARPARAGRAGQE